MVKKSARRTHRTHNPFFKARVALAALIAMARGFVYLKAVVDVASRRVMAHKVAITLAACHAKEVIEQAFVRHGSPQIVNVDQGESVHRDRVHRGRTGQGLQVSMDGRGAWRESVFVKRFWRSLKYERVVCRAYDSVSAARTDIAQYVERFNVQRPHSSLADATPDEFCYADEPTIGQVA